ncbi:MAG: DNA-3-methyladenine glycosylase 2 family protein [Robiginitomaculum sp.]|nr:DNA-3-methyladenine glycosylase 2 family protein [Robiginitomaculum sp.]
MNNQAIKHLSQDPVMAGLIAIHPKFSAATTNTKAPYQALLRSIVYQQISGKAAATIFGRFLALFPDEYPKPEELATADIEHLRSAGLSKNKAIAVIDLAAKTIDGTIPATTNLLEMPDDEIIERLIAVRGIGKWTAQMYLMFTLERPDILPLDDIGILNGVRAAYQLDARPTKKQLQEMGVNWKPWRTLASWYLWRAADMASLPK